jgi:hypothetical protein
LTTTDLRIEHESEDADEYEDEDEDEDVDRKVSFEVGEDENVRNTYEIAATNERYCDRLHGGRRT